MLLTSATAEEGMSSDEPESGPASSEADLTPDLPVLHVLVVGFHHKKGCQVEYSYPPLIPDGESHSSELPSQWKHLPSLALPDGSHNFEQDTAYFHLPALNNPRNTVFGISCYRQIDATKIKNRTDDITRGTVQKSVCVLSRLPLYGQIQVKMSLITEAYFREGDFTRLDLIHQTYDNLNACLTDDMLHTQQLYVGLSARDFVQKFRQRSLVLFKLMLLERKVLFFQSPVSDLCSYFLTLLSLHPGMLERGLDDAACMVPVDTPPSCSPADEHPKEAIDDVDEEDNRSITSSDSIDRSIRSRLSGAFGYIASGLKSPSSDSLRSDARVESSNSLEVVNEDVAEAAVIPAPNFASVSAIHAEDFGLPLKVFTGGNLCHPYLSLSYMDILMQPSIHGYIIGATNVLFKQKRGMADVVVDIGADRIEVHDPELRRALSLTTEDLRFTDNLLRQVSSEQATDIFLDGVGWEGGDEWIRAQFRFYLVCLLRTSLAKEGSPSGSALQATSMFNATFMSMWKTTKNYRHWHDDRLSARENVLEIPMGHPFAGHLSVSDMRLHLSNTIASTEGGKKAAAAVATTGKAVAGGLTSTGKAISSAKGAFSSWITSLRSERSPSPTSEVAVEAKEEIARTNAEVES